MKSLTKTTKGMVLLALLAVLVEPLAANTIKKVKLQDGREDANRIRQAAYDTTGIGALVIAPIESSYDRDGYFAYKMNKSLLTPKPKLKQGKPQQFHPKADMGAVLTEALTSEAAAMGFDVVSDGPGADSAWRLGGRLRDVRLEYVPYRWGDFYMAYGYMSIELRVTDPTGDTRLLDLSIYNPTQFRSGTGWIGDEIKETLARFMIEAAQDVVARANRAFFHAPPHPEILAKVQSLETMKKKHLENELLLIGLSGEPSAVPALLGMLPGEDSENRRVLILNALANLGSAEAVDLLAQRYEDEDQDCRYYTLKALAYIGGEDALGLVATQGREDNELYLKRTAYLITELAP
jgi:hypothetical protein